MKKRVLSLLIALCLIVGQVPAVSAETIASGICGEDAVWVLTEDGTLTISGTGDIGSGGENPSWDAYQNSITGVVIEEGLTSIAGWSFNGYINLKTVSFPSTLNHIGMYAFSGSGLTSVVFPEGEIYIHQDAFSNCESLESISLRNAVIGGLYYSFSGCTNLKTVDTTGSVLGEDAGPYYTFSDCVSLTDIDFYTQIGNMTRIATSVFTRCHGLEKITIPANITEIATSAVGSDNLHTIIFEGDAPQMRHSEGYYENDYGELVPYVRGSFNVVAATCYYPSGNKTWTEDVLHNYGSGELTWVPYNPNNPFEDVSIGIFYYDPVMWAIEKGITNGLSATEFGPDAVCNRAQVVTFLWRAAGCPEPTSTVNPFVDVAAGGFYEKPVLWAVENGITTGTDATHFSPGAACNRATVVTFLYRAFESPAVSTDGLPFSDVPAACWYEAPIAWAVEQGVTNGLSATEFGPDASCNRAQVVTFLYRAYND